MYLLRRQYSKTSMYCMGQGNAFRFLCVRVMNNKWFDRFVTLCIILNSIALATKDYSINYDSKKESRWNDILEKIDIGFSVVFLLECIIKVIAMGFVVHKEAYLREAWNCLDFSIVLVSIASFMPGIDPSSLKVLRTARILRPLRSLNQLESMRNLIQTFIASIPGLLNVCMFMVFVFMIFAIISINFFVGQQYQFCRLTEEMIMMDDGVTAYWPINPDAAWQCSSDEMCSGAPNNLGEDVVAKCGNVYVEYGLDPMEYDGSYENEMINFDITSFNNVFSASLTIFQIISLEGWSSLMYNYQDNTSYATSSIFFCIVIIIGSLGVLNLVLASIMHSYLEQSAKFREEYQKQKEEEEKLKEIEITNKASDEVGLQQNASVPIIKNVNRNLNQEEKELEVANGPFDIDQEEPDKYQRNNIKNDSKQLISLEQEEQKKNRDAQATLTADKGQKQQFNFMEKTQNDLQYTSYYQPFAIDEAPNRILPTSQMLLNYDLDNDAQNNQLAASQIQKRKSKKLAQAQTQSILPFLGQQSDQIFQGILAHRTLEREYSGVLMLPEEPKVHEIPAAGAADDTPNLSETPESLFPVYTDPQDKNPNSLSSFSAAADCVAQPRSKNIILIQKKESLQNVQKDDNYFKEQPKQRSLYEVLNEQDSSSEISQIKLAEIHAEDRAKRNKFYSLFYYLVISVSFNFIIYCFILANTVTLAMYRFDQSDEQEQVLFVFDVIFVWVFALEMLAKLIGLGVRNYVRDSFNIFDGIIVVVSLIDFTLSLTIKVESADGIMSALRALRLLRVMKMARHWKAFQDILQIMVGSLKDISSFSVLLLLFMYIFALLGMELFAFKVFYDVNGDAVFGLENIQTAHDNGEQMEWPRENFNNISNSLVTVFIVITGEDWNEVMYLYVRTLSQDGQGGRLLAMLYFICLFMIGNITLISLFTSMLLKSQEQSVDAVQKEIEDKGFKRAQKVLQETDGNKQGSVILHLKNCCTKQQCSIRYNKFSDNFVKIFGGDTALRLRKKARLEKQTKNPRVSASPSSGNVQVSKASPSSGNLQVIKMNKVEPIKIPHLTPPRKQISGSSYDSNRSIREEKQLSPYSYRLTEERIVQMQQSREEIKSLIMENQLPSEKLNKKLQRPPALLHYDYEQNNVSKNELFVKQQTYRLCTGKSLYILKRDNPCRMFMFKLTHQKLFDAFIILMILFSTVMLAFEHPLDEPDSAKLKVLSNIDLVVTIIFCLEALLKIVSLGFIINGKNSYLQDSWNILDFTIVLISLISLSIDTDISFIKVLRVARILRPLRLIQKSQSLKVAITALMKAIPQIIRLQVVILFIIFMISILLTTLLSGKMFRCDLSHTNLSPSQQNYLVNDAWECFNYGGLWVTPQMNFDHTLRGMLTLFIFQSREGWIGLMWDSVDAVGINKMPVRDTNLFFIPLYMILVILLCLLFVNMFVRIVIETYNLEKDFIDFKKLLSPQQICWIQVQLLTYSMTPMKQIRGNSRFKIRQYSIMITHSNWFENFIMFCIILNTVVMALVWFDEPQDLAPVIEIVNYIFMAIFTLEAIIKIIALKKMYFEDSWNRFDFTIVSLTLVMLGLKAIQIDIGIGNGPIILRALRIGRIFRLIKQAEKLQIIFLTLLESSTSLGSLGLLLMILFFMFAIIGRSQFGLTKIGEPNQELNEHVNFRDFMTSFLLLMRCLTGESWHMIMFDLARTYDINYQCREGDTYEQVMENDGEPFNCGSPFVAYLFFTLFNILATQVFLNLFIAIIIDTFLGQTDHSKLPISKMQVQHFVLIWSKYDPDATGFIKIKDLEPLILDVSTESETRDLVIMRDQVLKSERFRKRFLTYLNIPTFNQLKCVMFYDTLQMLCDKKNLQHYKLAQQDENSEEEKKASGVLKNLGFKGFGSTEHDELNELYELEEQGSSKIDFEKTVRNMGRLNPKIKLMLELQKFQRLVHSKYAIYADTETNLQISDEKRRQMTEDQLKLISLSTQKEVDDLNLITTAHYYCGLYIAKAWKQKVAKRKASSSPQQSQQSEEKEKPIVLQSNSKNSNSCSSVHSQRQQPANKVKEFQEASANSILPNIHMQPNKQQLKFVSHRHSIQDKELAESSLENSADLKQYDIVDEKVQKKVALKLQNWTNTPNFINNSVDANEYVSFANNNESNECNLYIESNNIYSSKEEKQQTISIESDNITELRPQDKEDQLDDDYDAPDAAAIRESSQTAEIVTIQIHHNQGDTHSQQSSSVNGGNKDNDGAIQHMVIQDKLMYEERPLTMIGQQTSSLGDDQGKMQLQKSHPAIVYDDMEQ